jgi:transcriptional regulator with XRE-family HTH domain
MLRCCIHKENYAPIFTRVNPLRISYVVQGMASSYLLSQLAERTSSFLRHAGISQNNLCRYLSISDSSLSQFLNGTKGLAPEVLIKLCQTLSLSHAEIATKFSTPVRTSKILNLQESTQGQPARRMTLDANDTGSWVPGLTGVDPAIGNTISDPDDPTEEDLNCLRQVRKIHRQAIRAINGFINTAKQAKVNRDGTTEPTGQKFRRS